MAVNYNSPYFIDEDNKVVGPEVFITPEMREDKWKGGKTAKLTNSNAKKFLAPIKSIQQRLTHPPIPAKIKDPKTGKDILEPDYAKTHDWDEKKKKWVPKKGKEPVERGTPPRDKRTWGDRKPSPPKHPKGHPEAGKRIDPPRGIFPKGHPLEGKKKYAPRGAEGFEQADPAPPVVLRGEKTTDPLTGRRRTLHRQRYGKELSGRVAEGLKTGKFDDAGPEDAARRQKLALTNDQSSLFLKKELAKTIEGNIAADKDYYKKAENLDELENIFAVGKQIDDPLWGGNMDEANIERFISKIENRKPSKQEIYEKQKAELSRRHASRFGDRAWEPPVPSPRTILIPHPDARVEPEQRRAAVGASTRSRVGGAPRSYWTGNN